MATLPLRASKIETDDDSEPLKDDNPVREYLCSLAWDGIPRLDEMNTAPEYETET